METQLESNIDSNNTRLEEEIELVSNILKTELTARVEAVEQRVQQSLNEQAVKIDSKFKEQREYITPVSYTHLDVYKRQA